MGGVLSLSCCTVIEPLLALSGGAAAECSSGAGQTLNTNPSFLGTPCICTILPVSEQEGEGDLTWHLMKHSLKLICPGRVSDSPCLDLVRPPRANLWSTFPLSSSEQQTVGRWDPGHQWPENHHNQGGANILGGIVL